MKIRTLLGLTIIGSAVYAHKRHGGEFSVESVKKSFRDLWSGIQGKAMDVKAKAVELADKVPDKMKGVESSATGGRNAIGSAAGKPIEPASPARGATDERYGPNGPRPGSGRDR